MEVPSFTDLGKNARDVFKTGYHYGKGLIKCNVKTRSTGKFEMASDVSLNLAASKLSGYVETKYKPADNATLHERWTSDGTIFVGCELKGVPAKDTSVQSEIMYNPEDNARGIKLGAKFINENFNAACTISSEPNMNANILGAVVVAFKSLFIGYQGGYSTTTDKMTKNDVGLAFNYRDVGFHFRCTSIPNEYGLSLLYKDLLGCNAKRMLWFQVNPDWDAAVNGILARNERIQEWTVGAAAKYKLDSKSTLRFKFNTDLQLGTSLKQKLHDDVTLTLSFNVDCANLTRGGHKIGLALDVEA
ncbi:hypothetical protein KM043_017732 [Ampulex compressa]|nr:hypothetical protein KM043_017732 [Ampulex compressa]